MIEASSTILDCWEVLDFDPGQGSDADAPGWMPIPAPGDVYQALIASGRLDHPYRERNEAAAAWVRDREWWQRTTFVAPDLVEGETLELVFDGLDTFATLYLDGREIGRADNMFRPWTFPIQTRPGQTHRLAVRFTPTALALEGRAPPAAWPAFTDRISRSKRNLMRKAQFGWGWDWGPDLPTVGIWKEVRLEVRSQARIADLAFTTLSAADDRAEARIDLELAGATLGLRVEIVLTDPDGAEVFRTDRDAADAAPITLTLDRPRLWWTHDLGDQPLYALGARLLDGDRLLDEARRAVGLRTIRLDQSPDPDEPGATFFTFVLNGVPIFAKGACWVPATSFVGNAESEPYDRLLGQAVRANMNMIRVWGGGVYEPDCFYDLCDRLGLLVWQDFMFACAPYPDDAAFAVSVRAEVEHQVRRLRRHPSIALWCGNNENQAIHRINEDVSGVASPLPGATLYDDVIPGVLAALDPTVPYWPGSPWGGAHPNGMKAGDVHDWTVWHGVPPIPDGEMSEPFGYAPEKIVFQRYAEDSARFVSEFGIQAAPALATLKRWMAPADLDPDSEGFQQRIKDEAKKALAMVAPETGLPRTLQDYIDFTQWTQAEGLKFGIEHFRRRRPQCSGALMRQFNDCWPCVSWSLVDYDGVEKAAFHAIRRAFAPVLASFKALDGDAVELWITNDARSPMAGAAVVELSRLDGEVIWSEAVAFDLPSGASHAIWSGPVPVCNDRVLTVRSPDEAFLPNRKLLAPISQVALDPQARPAVMVRMGADGGLDIDLGAKAYLAFVHVVSDRPDLVFSDNHFDLAAGERRTISVTGAWPVASDEIAVRCWNGR